MRDDVFDMPSDMSELDVFVLALISKGLGTPYELKATAGLSIGSSAPALRRLEKNGWISADQPGVRRKRKFSLTKAGRNALRIQCLKLEEKRPSSMDEILRAAYLTAIISGTRPTMRVLERGAADLSHVARLKQAEADQLLLLSRIQTPAWYRWLKVRSQATEAEAHARLLAEVAREYRRNKPSKQNR
jgi:DNA-binding PadR family transcriptional regulator